MAMQIIHAGFDNIIIGVVIVVGIVIRIVAATREKQAPKSGNGQNKPQREPGNAESELRVFLRSLTGEQPARHQPQSPQPAAVPPPVRRVVAPAPARTPKAQRVPSAPMKVTTVEPTLSPELQALLKSRAGLRNALIAGEILAAPLALRD